MINQGTILEKGTCVSMNASINNDIGSGGKICSLVEEVNAMGYLRLASHSISRYYYLERKDYGALYVKGIL